MRIAKKYDDPIKKIIPWILIVIMMYLMTLLKLPLIITNVFFVSITAICMYRMWNSNSESNIEVAIIWLGFALRILVCLIDIYGTEFITIPFSGDDSMHFYNTSVAYYHGDMSRIYTNYPFIINAIYQIAGLNRFAAQYVNILCWCFCALIMQKSCKLLQIEKNLRIVAIGLLSIMPFHICISSILMRDLIVTLSIMLTTYCLLKWMKEGNYWNLFIGVLATVPVMLVHNCVLAMLGVLGIMAALYSPEKGKFCIEKKCIVILAFGTVGVLAIALVPSLRNMIFTQIPIFNGGLIEMINDRLHYFYVMTGGSTYLLNEYVKNYWDLFVGTFQRIGYFLFSPVPWMWRGFSDIAGFLASVSMVLISTLLFVISFGYKKKDSYRTLLFMVIFFVSGIFAWGVSNGGTALRHREKLLGVLILLGVYTLQLIINARKERTNCTKKEA